MANEARNRRRSARAAGRRWPCAPRRPAPTARRRAPCSRAELRTALLDGARAAARRTTGSCSAAATCSSSREAETAAALGVPTGTVKSRTSRALERLRGEVERSDRPRARAAGARRRVAADARPSPGAVRERIVTAAPAGAAMRRAGARRAVAAGRSSVALGGRSPSCPRRGRPCSEWLGLSRASRSTRGRCPRGTPARRSSSARRSRSRRRVPRTPVLVPRSLGTPSGRLSRRRSPGRPRGGESLAVSAGVLVQTFKARASRRSSSKTVGSAMARQAAAGRRRAARTGSSGAHGFVYSNAHGTAGFEPQRIAGNTLLVEQRRAAAPRRGRAHPTRGRSRSPATRSVERRVRRHRGQQRVALALAPQHGRPQVARVGREDLVALAAARRSTPPRPARPRADPGPSRRARRTRARAGSRRPGAPGRRRRRR